MIGLCGLLSDMSRGPFEPFLESAITSYSDTKSNYFSERAVLFYYEMLKERHLYKEAAALLIKMAGEDLDLKAALFLEQAGVCFLRSYPCESRKYIFHLILAGHRFIKCGHVGVPFLASYKAKQKTVQAHTH